MESDTFFQAYLLHMENPMDIHMGSHRFFVFLVQHSLLPLLLNKQE